MRWRRTTAASALWVTLAAVALGQGWHQGKGRLEGTVTGPKGEPIAGATVAMRLDGQGPDLKTDKKGHWAILGINGGSWELDVSAPGYQSRKITVSVSEITRIPPMAIQLEPEVQQQPAASQQEVPITVGGKAISKDAAQ